MIPISKPYIDSADIKSVEEQISSGWISSNASVVLEFEQSLANFVGCDPSCALAVSNGTTAIELALRTFKLNKSQKVIVPDITFAATINAVIAVGLSPLILPVDDKFCYEENTFHEACSSNYIGAIIFVHLYGIECITEKQYNFIERNKNIYTIADCAESFDAFKNNKHLGLFCDAFTFSFFANKIITTGEGGFLGFKKVDFANKAKLIRDHGMSKEYKYWHIEYGTNTRMTALQASLGLSQLKKINYMIETRRELLYQYIKLLKPSNIFKVWEEEKYLSIWFVNLTLKENYNGSLLFDLAEFLKEKNIETRPCFHNLSEMPIYSEYASFCFKNDNKVSLEKPTKNLKLISLPTFVGLKQEEIAQICKMILKFESIQ